MFQDYSFNILLEIGRLPLFFALFYAARFLGKKVSNNVLKGIAPIVAVLIALLILFSVKNKAWAWVLLYGVYGLGFGFHSSINLRKELHPPVVRPNRYLRQLRQRTQPPGQPRRER